jgi:hypothetical protein
VTYLIVGLDRSTLARWHHNVLARDVTAATRIARARAARAGVELVVAAVIGPNSSVLADPAGAMGAPPEAIGLSSEARARKPRGAARRLVA